MVTKIIALVFVLLATTSGWAKDLSALDNNSKYCPLTNSWVALGDHTASIQQAQNDLVLPGGKAMHEGRTNSYDQNSNPSK